MIDREGIMDRYEEIRLIAYQIWEEEGWVNGRELEHWTRAEQIWESRKPEPAIKSSKKTVAKRDGKSKNKNTK
jgi:hypothetical protein